MIRSRHRASRRRLGGGGWGGGGRGGGWAVMGECKGLLVTLALGPHLSNNLSHKKDLSQLIIQL